MARFQKGGDVSTIGEVNSKFEQVETSQSEMLSRVSDKDNAMHVNLDMNSKRVINLPTPVSDREPVPYGMFKDGISGTVTITEVQQEGVVNVAQQFDAGDSKGNTPAENLAALDAAISYAKANGHTKIYLPSDTYTISDTWVVPSAFEIFGDVGRLGSRVHQPNTDAPVIANEAWANNTSPDGSVYIHDLWISGDNAIGSNNVGIRLTDYFSRLERLYISACGGYGIYLDSRTENGTLVTGTLVENSILNVEIAGCEKGFRNGDNTIAPKLTDGIINNLIINMVGAPSSAETMELYEAAGWIVDGLHVYGNDTAVMIDKASNFNASNWYLENKGSVPTDTVSVGVNLANTGRSVSFNNVVLLGQEKGSNNLFMDGDKVFRIFGSTGIDIASVNLSNVSAVVKHLAGSEDAVILASRESTNLRINVSNFQPHYSISTVAEIPVVTVGNTVGASSENGSFLDKGAELRLRSSLTEENNDFERVSIGAARIAKSAIAETDYFGATHIGAYTHSVTLNVPELSTSDFHEGTLTINLSQDYSFTQQAFWTGRLLVGSDNASANSWYYILNKVGTDVRMSTDPTISVDGVNHTITVTFTHDGVSDLGTGIVHYSFANGPE